VPTAPNPPSEEPGTLDDAAVPPQPSPANDACFAHDYRAEIAYPADGATDLPTDLTLRYRWNNPSIPDKYTALQASVGQFFGGPESVANDYYLQHVTLGPNTSYTFEIGWICSAGGTDSTDIPLAKISFRTGP
jgi:hypothetical protein